MSLGVVLELGRRRRRRRLLLLLLVMLDGLREAVARRQFLLAGERNCDAHLLVRKRRRRRVVDWRLCSLGSELPSLFRRGLVHVQDF